MDPTFPLFPIFAFLGFILPLIPLPWHLLAWNSGTCYYIFWSSLACLNLFVNSLVWHNNALNPAPIWCDISIRIFMGASVGIPAASLCINRRLYHIASVQNVSITTKDKRRAILYDTLICIVFPMIFIPMQYIVQGHRFNIYEDIGCYPALYNTLPTYFIYLMWPIILGLISAVYCVMTLRAFIRRRADFHRFLAASTALTVGRYFRLMALAMTEMLCTTPLAAVVIYLNATTTPISPWISWEDTHFNYGQMTQIPAVFWRSKNLVLVSLELTRWMTVFCSLVFFAFFGFSEEARKSYRKAFDKCLKILGLQRPILRKAPSSMPPKPLELPLYLASKATFADSKPPYSATESSQPDDTLYEPSTPDELHFKINKTTFDACTSLERGDRRFTL
uniref:Putative pheromone receptor n=1 Tax=Flammulina velutipes TaxID=38945 RepID=M4MKR9_FLAVE|nr:putative pheromone receptor [Flammulina velutipes]QPK40832.1 putative pheromone receptor [Flammulina velutipes]